jgi:DNA-directed RNA polymerase subunit RPC12/RpoP
VTRLRGETLMSNRCREYCNATNLLITFQEQLVVGKSKFKAKKGAEVTLLSCKLCSYEVKFHGGRCNAAGHLRKHMESAHGVKQPKFSCDKCSYSSTQAGHLRRHKNAKHEGIRYQCSLCEKSFSIKDGLTRHVENIHKGTTIPCPQCEYETPRMAVLRDHIKIKHLKLKYECDICGHKLNSKKNLKIHKNAVHEGIWLHCPEAGCDYKAKDSSTFRLNMFCVVSSFK